MLNPDLIDRFTTHLKEALQKALAFAVSHGRDIVEPGDLVVGLLYEKGSIGAEILIKNNANLKKAELLFSGNPHITSNVATPDLSEAVKKTLEKCVLTAHLYEHRYVGTEHLAYAILESAFPDITAFFEKCGTNTTLLREHITQVLKSTSRFQEIGGADYPLIDESLNEPRPIENPPLNQAASQNTTTPLTKTPRATRVSALDTFTNDMTKIETASELDPVIGRERELERIIEILCRRTKNNPVLLGEPGVGKTAIIEGLAKKLAEGDVPDILRNKKILTLDLAQIVAGTMYRGEFEARIKQVMDEAKNDPNVILFIDEMHNIVGAGSTSGSLDAANILKPALARGQVRCIGATTYAEFKKHIEADAALERRFQPVHVNEPNAEATLIMLRGIKSQYEKFHKVKYADEALLAAVRLSERYITDRHFPDKAVDLLDEAAAGVNARIKIGERGERIASLEIALDAIKEQKSIAINEGRLHDAETATQDIERLDNEKIALQKKLNDDREKNPPLIRAKEVEHVVSSATGIALDTIQMTDRERMSNLETILRASIFGQDTAIQQVSDVITRSRLGLADPEKPRACLLFVGPSGTGKTELARTIAKELFGREDALVKLDMTEFSEGHSVSKLVGAPAGYVGYRETNKLTDALRKKPHCVLLFDEFEKAHVDVQNILLQILEDGKISDGSGRPISMKHAYIILTSNVGNEKLGSKPLGFDGAASDIESLIKTELTQRFRPELLNRLDRVIVFTPLETMHMRRIVERELRQTISRVEKAQHVAIRAGKDVIEFLMSRPIPQEEGARSAKRLLDTQVTSLISKMLTKHPQKRKLTLHKTATGLGIK